MTQRAPDFFIVGQPKAGTTALHAMLRQHPQIYMPSLKEPEYFADELIAEPHSPELPTTLDAYLSLFTPATPDQVIGEASASYLWSRTAAHNIALHRPDARIIMIWREPASFLCSLHLEYLKVRIETEKDLRRALALEHDRRQGRQRPRNRFWPQLLSYSEHMSYTAQLCRYNNAFPADQILVLIYDDFRHDNKATVRAILRFLGVSDTVPILPVDANPSVRVRTDLRPLLNAVSEGRGKGVRLLKTAFEAVTTQSLRRRAKTAFRERIIYAKPKAPDHELMSELRRQYKPEVVALSEHLGRDLVSLWGYDEVR